MKKLSIPHFDQITPQSCIPACLQQVFSYYNISISQENIISTLIHPNRGMSIPAAGNFFHQHGLKPLVITNNINLFDPVWFKSTNKQLINRLEARRKHVNKYNQSLIDDFISYLSASCPIDFNTICDELIQYYLSKNLPVIAELTSTFLYKKSKTNKPGLFNDAISGDMEEHGVVLAGYNNDKFLVIDPNTKNNPFNRHGIYWSSTKELIMSIATSEGKSLLIVSPN